MTGPEHYDEAQRLLVESDSCEYACPHSGCRHEMRLIARAQAHATLALAAATALNFVAGTPGLPEPDFDAWDKLAGVPLDISGQQR